ncbi:MAG: TonB-dependent receptor [Thiolinea sp.]
MNKFAFTLTASGLSSLSLFSFSSGALAADDAVNVTAQSPIEVVITAGRKQQAVSDTLASTSVVTREALEKSQAKTLGEVLSRLPGITIANQGGVGKLSPLFLRGTESDHVLVLVDGVKMGSATAGTPQLEYLPVAQIERIEVVRGPRSSLYGSEAIGGVIQIFTRQGSKNGFTPKASISVGSNNTRKADVGLSGGNGQSWYNLNVATERTDGINALDFYQSYPPPDYSPVKVFESDKDGFSNDSLAIRAGHEFANGATAEISAMHSRGDSDYDGGFQNETDFLQQALSAKLTTPIGDNHRLTAQLGRSLDETDNFKDGVPSTFFDTKRTTAGLQAESQFGASGLVYGVDFQNDEVDSTTPYVESSRDNTGIFASYELKSGANSFAAAVRNDDNEQFGKHTTGSVALGHELDNGVRLKASYGTAFRAPNFNDLYWPDDGSFSGNPDLNPEKSKTLELGVAGELEQGNWAVNVFDTRVDDLISYVYNAATYSGTMENVDKAKIRGIELEARQRVADWTFAANATYQQTENLTGFNKGKQLTRRPEKVLNLSADRQFGPLELGVAVHAEGARYMDAANTDRLGGFTTVDLRGRYQLAKDWSVSAKVGNLLDKEYEMVRNYNQDGINGLITLEYQPK